MTADYRFFIKVHNGFPEHPKTGGLSDRAFRNLIELWCYCSRNLTDGIVTKPQGNKILSRKSCGELIAAGYLIEHPDTYELREYLDHQMSAAQVADLREKRAEAGKRGGYAKANRVASATANGKQTPSKSVADKDEDIDTDQKTTTELPSSAEPMARPKYPIAFERFWKTYPRKVGKDSAFKAWQQVRGKVEYEDVMRAVERMAADPNLPDESFIPHPTTWLRRGGWDDAPFPPRSNGRASPSGRVATSDQRVADGLDLARRLAQREARDEQQQRMEIEA